MFVDVHGLRLLCGFQFLSCDCIGWGFLASLVWCLFTLTSSAYTSMLPLLLRCEDAGVDTIPLYFFLYTLLPVAFFLVSS